MEWAYQHALLLAQVVDTTGAGDTFTAAYAVALLDGRSQQEALRFAGEVNKCNSKSRLSSAHVEGLCPSIAAVTFHLLAASVLL